MELRELAEQVLFGTTLADKLLDGGGFMDRAPGPGISTPSQPGRSASLALKRWNERERVRFNEVKRFHTEKEQGLVLHFFANHELLALELMALALLKFPNAPEKFRRGLYGILREEQEHLRLYLERMRAVGVEFGEIPVSDFFWRTISSMATPIDFVARLSLTLEQANLDYAPHFSRVYDNLGDTHTAQLMRRIYRDEIGHVKHGLTWFNTWRDPKTSEWEAYSQVLTAPLNPSRAKGIGFNIEGRRLAGLSEEFVNELAVHSHSRGRCPDVFWFNPASDRYAGMDSVAYTPPRTVLQMTQDLETLPALLCKADDVVLVRARPKIEFLSELQSAGLTIPEFVDFDGTPAGLQEHPISSRKLHRLRPWGQSPDSARLLVSLRDCLSVANSWPIWNSRLRRMYSKEWGADLLRRFLAISQSEWLCSSDTIGMACQTMSEVWTAVNRFFDNGTEYILIKACFGAAGQGHVRLTVDEVRSVSRKRQWVERLLNDQGCVVVEPLLDGVVDLSAQYEVVGGGEVRLLGTTRFVTDKRGQYLGSFLNRHVAGLDTTTRKFLYGDGKDSRRLRRLYEELQNFLETEAKFATYSGPIGVDALVYRTQGKLLLKPIIEINPRFTMGRIALYLARRVNAARTALWLMLRVEDIEALGYDLNDFAAELRRRYPLEMTPDGGQISRGILFTTDPENAQAFVTLLVVADTLGECKAVFKSWPGRLSEWTRNC